MKKSNVGNVAGEKGLPLSNEKATDADETLKEAIVLQDECGDTLWDEVLALQDTILHIKNNIENGGGCNSGDKNK